MSQRNPMNERYQGEGVKGKTRKSASSAKPVAERASMVRPPAEKTKKQKKQERKERERKQEEKIRAIEGAAYEADSDKYKKLRRLWWVFLIAAIASTALSWWLSSMESTVALSYVFIVIAYVTIIIAFYIDFGKIRKMRNKNLRFNSAARKTKEARKIQKEQHQKLLEAKRTSKEAYAEEHRRQREAAENEGQTGLFANLGDIKRVFKKDKKKDAVELAEEAREKKAAEPVKVEAADKAE